VTSPHNSPTAEYVRERLSYDPETGFFVWLPFAANTRGFNAKMIGKRAGSLDANGYRVIGLMGKLPKAHRLAWLVVTGHFPSGHIDHINGVPDDNRIENLREASHADNMRNRGVRRDSAVKVKGVYHAGNRFYARAKIYGRSVHIGTFKTLEDAAAAYDAFALQNHGAFARPNSLAERGQ
jgi:hypothetical protein